MGLKVAFFCALICPIAISAAFPAVDNAIQPRSVPFGSFNGFPANPAVYLNRQGASSFYNTAVHSGIHPVEQHTSAKAGSSYVDLGTMKLYTGDIITMKEDDSGMYVKVYYPFPPNMFGLVLQNKHVDPWSKFRIEVIGNNRFYMTSPEEGNRYYKRWCCFNQGWFTSSNPTITLGGSSPEPESVFWFERVRSDLLVDRMILRTDNNHYTGYISGFFGATSSMRAIRVTDTRSFSMLVDVQKV